MKTVQRHPVVWPWILVLLIIAVMVWGVVEIAFERNLPEAPAVEPGAGPDQVGGSPSADDDTDRNP